MEEEKAAAYYDELTLKGGGAARFKQGLGFSSSSGDLPAKGSALPSSSSFLSTFVKASTSTNSSQIDSQSQLSNIQNKLKKKVPISPIHQKTPSLHDDSDIIRVRDRSRERDRGRGEERQLRSRSRERRRERHRSSSRERRRGLRRRSRSRERSRRSSSRERRRDRERDLRRRSRSRERCRRSSSRESRDKDKDRRRKRSLSPRGRKSEKGRGEGGGKKEGGNGGVDYSKLIEGYDHMTPAERVKAKMKVQLSQTAEKDEKMGTGSQWERFEFDKDAPVDDEELPAADDDATVVKRIGHSFRFASLEGKREDELRNAHDEAMFGVPARQVSHTFESEEENKKENEGATDDDNDLSSVLLNEKVLSKQQGSWRDRARRNAG